MAGASVVTLKIDKLVYGGSGLARHEGKVVFVPFTVPGDIAEARIVSDKKSFSRAVTTKILEAGPGRREAPCKYFGDCGGCQWQHLDYPIQVETKRAILEELIRHHFPETGDLSITMTASPESYGYRPRARIQLRGTGRDLKTGFYRFQSHQVVDIESCPLLRPTLNEALSLVREAHRRGEYAHAAEMDLACSDDDHTWALALAGESRGRVLPFNNDDNAGLLTRRIGEFDYKASAAVFFQANDFLIENLVAAVRDLSRRAERNSALDLYAGLGLFTLPLGQLFRKVTAVESSARACRLCSRNAATASMQNIKVRCADVASWMQAVSSVTIPAFDLVLLDPPRTGAGRDVMRMLNEWAPAEIIYVSCDPQTLVRDLRSLSPRDYLIDHVEGMELFPQTYHFETIVRLKRR